MSPSFLTPGFNEVESVIAKTMEYLSIPSVVGYEGFFLNHLAADFTLLGMETVKHSRLLEVRGRAPESAVICAHIDRHGLISTGNKEYAYAAQHVRRVKYDEENRTSRKELQAIASRFDGEAVFAYDPATAEKLGEGVIETCAPCIERGEALFLVWGMEQMPAGTPLAYARTARAQNSHIKGQLDNALSLGVVYALFKNGFQGTALLTAEEEIGKSWIYIARWLEEKKLETQRILVLDTSPYQDEDPIEDGLVVLRGRDKSENFNAALTGELRARCEALGQPFQFKDEMLLAAGKEIDDLGSTELGRLIQGSQGRWSGATVQIPTNMYHTSKETTTRKAIQNYFRFLANILIEEPLTPTT